MAVVLVTGGNRGIGLAIARRFAAAGDAVAVTYRDTPPEGPFLPVRCDVTDLDQVESAYATVEKELGPVEVLVANAGIVRDRLMAVMSQEDFDVVLDTNLTGVFRVTRRALRNMLRQRRGRVVLVSSTAGLSGSPGQTNYAAAKAGLVGLARSLAREVGGRGITVNVLAPGWVSTDMTAGMSEADRAASAAEVPLGRFGTPEEVAEVAYFLGSPAAAYVTGAVVPVDGGLGMGH
ncbi:3-oxoacyl-[acyl-carrier-protein] reductase [Streptoalloteichus tenebrarius]|uniref:3-oxoacyl-[acyl-carrier-protein] reductase n=1 Tax=Streptoalloteichus tenebrarius (strain ATCC 17920 / DSM 40477 / JCM 4838 / CBS 697.72 / NBRC 16177 / NCIMB 11028 / NRRL B-12390 / A12253. 1 / ISP 5477) TaxID=1933 RepID=A0ABT1HU41_STRSD|nr:3-oxoacyl-ACP reductase FabG [Streptoalloteichus tenebrarius]MCP2259048.1 3-oxoacyl-[acyl-carrier-protein] reductase [Streptoalloteichus tenebrarius]BFE99626.1 3-oxoacyl-[acyl-carrier-protein] reductase [Streptoalloteichus tenebrarius]